MATFGKLVLLAVGAVVGILYWGFVLATTWQWFIASTFGLPLLSIQAAIGVSIFSGCIFRTNPYVFKAAEKQLSSSERWLSFVSESFGIPSFVLVFGWVLHTFFM